LNSGRPDCDMARQFHGQFEAASAAPEAPPAQRRENGGVNPAHLAIGGRQTRDRAEFRSRRPQYVAAPPPHRPCTEYRPCAARPAVAPRPLLAGGLASQVPQRRQGIFFELLITRSARCRDMEQPADRRRHGGRSERCRKSPSNTVSATRGRRPTSGLGASISAAGEALEAGQAGGGGDR